MTETACEKFSVDSFGLAAHLDAVAVSAAVPDACVRADALNETCQLQLLRLAAIRCCRRPLARSKSSG